MFIYATLIAFIRVVGLVYAQTTTLVSNQTSTRRLLRAFHPNDQRERGYQGRRFRTSATPRSHSARYIRQRCTWERRECQPLQLLDV